MKNRKTFETLDDYFDYLNEQLPPHEQFEQLRKDIREKAQREDEDPDQ